MGTRLGIFGGTFNPIHFGHLRMAEDVRDHFSLDRILFVPTNLPPHKVVEQHIPPEYRMHMVEMAIDGNQSFLCDDVELKRGGHSYTIDTVEYIYREYEFADKPYLILGSDLIPELDEWKDIERLTGLVHFIILNRANYPFVSANSNDIIGLCYTLYEGRQIQITSSEIRSKLQEGKSIRYLVPDVVLRYIIDKGLYTRDAL
jgi:nicotinate-nucleotide adenylyltransferase